MAEVLLIQPKAGKWEKLGIRPPDSLLTIAAPLKKEGYKIKIFDQRLSDDWKKDLLKYLKEDLICIGTTSMTGLQIKYALEVSKFIKENSTVPIVWGGIHPTLLPEQTLENRYIDIVVVGEGDYTFLDLVTTLKNNRDLSKVKGILYKKNSKIIKNEPRPRIKNLDELPPTPYDLIDLKKYYGMDIDGEPSMTLITSRGCPARCGFCYNSAFHDSIWRGQSAERVIETIKYVTEKFNIRNICFEDDNFCADIKRFREIIGLILKEKIDIKWGLLGARVNSLQQMDEPFLNKVINAGCVNIDIGIESGNERILKMVQKDNTIPQIIDANKKLSKFDIKTKFSFVGGVPTETESELKDSIRLALKLIEQNKNAYALFFIYTVYPRTALYQTAIEHGFKPPKSLEEWCTFDFENVYLPYPWLTKRSKKMLRNLSFVSYFANKNIKYKIQKKYHKFLFDLYHPIARFRFRRNFHHLQIERVFLNLITKNF